MPARANEKSEKKDHLKFHYWIVSIIYLLAFFIAYKVISSCESQKDLVTLLSTGAIFATFGSAVCAIGLVWQGDLLERVKLNVDIFYRDILKQEIPWRRWPFLPRRQTKKTLDGSSQLLTLTNPQVPLDIGTHVLTVDLPTVLEDFFELPVIRNFQQLYRFRSSARTVVGNKKKDEIHEVTKLSPSDGYMAYECLFDIWYSVLKFRVARYVVHAGSGLTIAGTLITTIFVLIQ